MELNGSRTHSQYKRAYKACESCRRSKAKCVVESGEVVCARCRRECKECVFPETRSRKRRKSSRQKGENLPGEADIDSDPGLGGSPVNSPSSPLQRHTAKTFASSVHLSSARPVDRRVSSSDNSDRVTLPLLVNETGVSHDPEQSTNDVTRTVVRSSHDAMGVLFSAAQEHESDELEDEDVEIRTAQMVETPHSARLSNMLSPGSMSLGNVSAELLELWSHYRFVRQGWFTAREAINYIDLFFTNLAHLSPAVDVYYADHKTHKKLILEEPLLCCTLLTISSRYHVLPGAGGSSRAEFIHHRMWKHTEHLIQRITFGQEKYSIAKTRTLGSIQALLLLTEWHPRALHFPPENDGWDASLAPSIDDTFVLRHRDIDAVQRWREEVFEPAKRSDRMSWMLIGLATTLAHELGVFEHQDDEMEDDFEAQGDTKNAAKIRTRNLLFLYVNQLSLRLGCTSMLPYNSVIQSNSSSPKTGISSSSQSKADQRLMISKWIELTRILKTASEMFFSQASGSSIKKLLRNNRYISLIDHFEPLLRTWHNDFSNLELPSITQAAKQMLLIEYHYVRMFVCSTAMQAMVERAGQRSNADLTLDIEFLRNEHSHDLKYVNQVRESSASILEVAIALEESNNLQFAPIRLILRIVTGSIFLLKSLSLGSKDSQVTASLDVLDRCIEALKCRKTDEMHLSTRYAILIARHVRRFRRSCQILSEGSSRRVRQTGKARTSTNKSRSYLETRQQAKDYNLSDSTPQLSNSISTEVPSDPGTSSADYGFADFALLEDCSWLTQPFDPQIAPFSFDLTQPAASGLALDSLDFLWNLPNPV